MKEFGPALIRVVALTPRAGCDIGAYRLLRGLRQATRGAAVLHGALNPGIPAPFAT